MIITVTRSVQRRCYRITRRAEGAYALSICWDDSDKLDKPMCSMTFTDTYPDLESAQAAAVHLPMTPTWTRTGDTWETETFLCDSGGNALEADVLLAAKRKLGRRHRQSQTGYFNTDAAENVFVKDALEEGKK